MLDPETNGDPSQALCNLTVMADSIAADIVGIAHMIFYCRTDLSRNVIRARLRHIRERYDQFQVHLSVAEAIYAEEAEECAES